MRLLIINTLYQSYIRWLYSSRPALADSSFQTQLDAHHQTFFGIGDAYSTNLRALGHEAIDVYANVPPMQSAWAREHHLPPPRTKRWNFRLRRGVVPWISLDPNKRWMYDVLAAQIKHYAPDAVLNHDLFLDTDFFRRHRRHFRLLIGQHAATALPNDRNWKVYDLILSSFQPTIQWLLARGVPAQLFRLAFDTRILDALGDQTAANTVSFVGSFHPVHRSRLEWIEHVCAQTDVDVWTPDADAIPADSPIRPRLREPLWGLDMYRAMRNSAITLNHHGSIPPVANNMRLYEATGVNTTLITDWKSNLHQLFEPGIEVLAYRSPQECVDLIRYHLDHQNERRSIAVAGQARTLRDHTYHHRMVELLTLVEKHLPRQSPVPKPAINPSPRLNPSFFKDAA